MLMGTSMYEPPGPATAVSWPALASPTTSLLIDAENTVAPVSWSAPARISSAAAVSRVDPSDSTSTRMLLGVCGPYGRLER